MLLVRPLFPQRGQVGGHNSPGGRLTEGRPVPLVGEGEVGSRADTTTPRGATCPLTPGLGRGVPRRSVRPSVPPVTPGSKASPGPAEAGGGPGAGADACCPPFRAPAVQRRGARGGHGRGVGPSRALRGTKTRVCVSFRTTMCISGLNLQCKVDCNALFFKRKSSFFFFFF